MIIIIRTLMDNTITGNSSSFHCGSYYYVAPSPSCTVQRCAFQSTSNFQLCEWGNRESQANVYNYQPHVREE